MLVIILGGTVLVAFGLVVLVIGMFRLLHCRRVAKNGHHALANLIDVHYGVPLRPDPFRPFHHYGVAAVTVQWQDHNGNTRCEQIGYRPNADHISGQLPIYYDDHHAISADFRPFALPMLLGIAMVVVGAAAFMLAERFLR